MRVGILADTHGRIGPAKLAMEMLRDGGCEMFIHCGDVGSAEVLDLLAGHDSTFVFGNNDFDHEVMRLYAKHLGITCLGTGGKVQIDGKKLAVTHGDDLGKVRALLADEPDYLFTGHTHIAQDIRQGKTRWINPGALHRAVVKSVAVLDLDNDGVEFLKV